MGGGGGVHADLLYMSDYVMSIPDTDHWLVIQDYNYIQSINMIWLNMTLNMYDEFIVPQLRWYRNVCNAYPNVTVLLISGHNTSNANDAMAEGVVGVA